MRMASTVRPTMLPDNSMMAMLLKIGAIEHIMDDEQIPRWTDRMMNSALLDVPKTNVTAGARGSHGTTTGILYGTVVDRTGKAHFVRFPGLIGLSLALHVCFSSVATK